VRHAARDLGQQGLQVDLAGHGDRGLDDGVELAFASPPGGELPPIARASSSMSSTAIRRWPPAVRVQGRKPVAVQRRMVTGETPSRRAARWTFRKALMAATYPAPGRWSSSSKSEART
jgi:hypothetical protein